MMINMYSANCLPSRVHHRWRVIWKALQVSWKQICPITKTKSCASYVLCESFVSLMPLYQKSALLSILAYVQDMQRIAISFFSGPQKVN